MGALTDWQLFNMQQVLQPPHLVRLGEAMEETRRAASTVLDQIQQTIFLLEFIGV